MGTINGVPIDGVQVKFQNSDEPTVEITEVKSFTPSQVGLNAASHAAQNTSDIHIDVQSQVEEAAQSHKDSESQGVDLKKKAFVKNLAVAIGSGIAVGVSLFATIATGGATAPLLFLATTHLGVAVGDSICSYMDWKGKRTDLLPMGQDSVGNLAFAAMKKLGYQDANAFRAADKISIVTRGLIAFATLSSNETLRVKAPAVMKHAVKQGYYSAQASHIKQQDALATPVKLSQLPKEAGVEDSADETTPLLRTSSEAQQKLSELEQKGHLAEQELKQKFQQVSDRRAQWIQHHTQSVQFHPENETLSYHAPEPVEEEQPRTAKDGHGVQTDALKAKVRKTPEYRQINQEISKLRTQINNRDMMKPQYLEQKAKHIQKSSTAKQMQLVVDKKGKESFKLVQSTPAQTQQVLNDEAMYFDRKTEKLLNELKAKRAQKESMLSSALDYLNVVDESHTQVHVEASWA